MATVVEYGVNEVVEGCAPCNPFDSNFDTHEEAVAEGKAFMRQNPEVNEIVIFELTICNDTIVKDETLQTITRKDLGVTEISS